MLPLLCLSARLAHCNILLTLASHSLCPVPFHPGLCAQVASLQQQLQEQRQAAEAAWQQADEATQQKVAALVRVSDAESGRTRADGRIEQLTQARREGLC